MQRFYIGGEDGGVGWPTKGGAKAIILKKGN